MDRISHLPDGLLDQIVSYLHVYDAVRTSLVARQWRNCWQRSQKPVFDYVFFVSCINGRNDRFEDIVNSIISRHSGPIRKFLLTIPQSWFEEHKTLSVGDWIGFLSRNGIERIKISSGMESPWKKYLELTPQIYDCEVLTSLELVNCKLDAVPHGFNGFKNLRYLELENIDVAEGVMDSVISSSPSLNYVDLIFFDNDGSPVVVDAPTLHELSYLCYGSSRPIQLLNVPNLTLIIIQAELLVPTLQKTFKLEIFVSLLPQIWYLCLDGIALKSLAEADVPSKLLSTVFRNLEALHLDPINIFSNGALPTTFYLIRCSPMLTTLSFDFHDESASDSDEDVDDEEDTDEDVAENFLLQQEQEGILSNLNEVSFESLLGLSIEVSLIKSIVKCCPSLFIISLELDEETPETEDETWWRNSLRDLELPRNARMMFKSSAKEGTSIFELWL